MESILSQFLVTFFILIIFVILYNSTLRFQYKLGLPLLIFTECIVQILFFSDKFSIYFSFIILISSLIAMSLSHQNYDKQFNLKKETTNYSFLQIVIDNSLLLGISLLLIYLPFEFFFLDGNVSLTSMFLILVSLSFIARKYFSRTHEFELNFAALFFSINFIIFFVIYLTERVFNILDFNFQYFQDNNIVVPFLMVPLENFLSILGFNVWSQGITLYYENLEANRISSVWIATGCSGFYSLVFFISAYISYMLIQYQKIDKVFIYFLFLGIIVAYLSNILRMAIIVIIGHYYGDSALLWTHNNLGWLIFVSWLLIFWRMLEYVLNENNS